MIVNSKQGNLFSRLEAIANANFGVITTESACNAGISRASLSLMAQNDKIERYAKGVYILPETVPDELYIISLSSQYIVFSHETSLFLHGITERTPTFHTFSLPRGKRLSSELSKECRIHYVKPEYFQLGRTHMKTFFGSMISCYDMERTICDIIRDRSKIDPETYIASIRMYGTHKDKNIAKLSEYAQKMNIVDKVRIAMEVII